MNAAKVKEGLDDDQHVWHVKDLPAPKVFDEVYRVLASDCVCS